MKDLSAISQDLFDKIRGRFPSVTLGNEEGKVTNDPKAARFFDFEYKESGKTLGNVSVSISEDDGLTVIYSKDLVNNEDSQTKDNWFSFLRDLRSFGKKRLLKFDVRDITKSNLTKRDYKFLAQRRAGDETMTESKLYGTSRISYQKIGEARLVIKHSEHINTESATGRTQKIGKIYIESPEGERFKYPYRHLSGARAMARHVAEGGNAYDDFGKHITGLSEEMSKLRKFKNYMNRSSVMAESLEGYMDIVKERISTVKKTIENLQKPNYYREAFDSFETPIYEEVPEDVAENWIDELTIKQFNEELADVFPYIYNLVKEGTRAQALGPDDLDESGLQYYTGVKKHGKEYMKKAAQAGREGASQEELGRLKDKYSKAAKKTKEEFELEQAFEDAMGQFADSVCEDCGNPSWRTLDEEKQKGVDGKVCWKGYKRMGTKMKGGKRVDNCVKIKEDDLDEGNAFAHAVRKAKMDGKKKGDKVKGPDGDEITLEKEGKTPLGEFILSYFDYTSGQFPKGETAVLTMVEKDYGEEFIEPAKAFIERINNRVAEVMGFREEPEQLETEGEIGERSQFEIYRNSIVLYDPASMEVKKTYPMTKAKAAEVDAKQNGLVAINGANYMELVRDKKRMAAQDIEKQAELPLRKEPKKPGALDRIKSLAGLS